MSAYASRYTQPILDVESVRSTRGVVVPAVVAAPGASVLVRVAGSTDPAPLYADREMATPLANPVPTGVELGEPGLDTFGNLVFWAPAGDGDGSLVYEAVVTIGSDVTGPIPMGSLPPDALEPPADGTVTLATLAEDFALPASMMDATVATQAELDEVSTDVAGLGVDVAAIDVALGAEEARAIAAEAGKQPLDSDLTAIAALSTTAYGRAFLALADAAAGRTALALGTAATQNVGAFDAAGAAAAAQAASQPLDSDLTALAALSTTSFGRSLLALADGAALAAAIPSGTYVQPPDATSKIIYVSPFGSDSNTGLTKGLGTNGYKLTLAGAKTALGGTTGTISCDKGNYTVTSQLDLDVDGLVLETQGQWQTSITCNAAMTAVIRIAASRVTLRGGFRLIKGASGSATYGIHVDLAASLSTQQVNIHEVFSDAAFSNTFAVGAATAGDVSEVNFWSCTATNATVSGWTLGNGTTANVLNVRTFGCDTRNNVVGVLINGCGIYWDGGTVQNNSDADFKCVQPPGSPIFLAPSRSEGSKRFWSCAVGTIDTPITMVGVVCPQYTDTAGKVVFHQSSMPMTQIGCTFRGGPSFAATVTNKVLTSNVATLTIGSGHGFNANQSLVVAGVDATFNGTYTITATTSTTVSYAKVAGDVATVAASGTATSVVVVNMHLQGTTANPLSFTAINVTTDALSPFNGAGAVDANEVDYLNRNVMGTTQRNGAGSVIPCPTANNMLKSAGQTITGGGAVTFDCNVANRFLLQMTSNVTSMTVTNPKKWQRATIDLFQNGGPFTVVYATNFKFAGGAASAPTQGVSSGRRTIIELQYDGTNWNEVSRAVNVGS